MHQAYLNIAQNIWVYSTVTHWVGGLGFLQFRVRWRFNSPELLLIFEDFATNFLRDFPPPTLAHFLNVVYFFNMIWIFLWHINVFNVRQENPSIWRRENTQIGKLFCQSELAKNGKERKESKVLLQRTEKNMRMFRSFFNIYIDI